MAGPVDRHLRACEGFSAVAAQGADRWARPSPCAEWDARDLVEHVIGFHDVLLLRPLDAKPTRPQGDPAARWAVTVVALEHALQALPDGPVPPEASTSAPDLHRLLPVLTADVLVHTWDLGRAIGVDPQLDDGLCRRAYEVVAPNEDRLRSSGMFDPPYDVPATADHATKLVAFLGRDPAWTPPA
jgi:uncharacterized protein (TIGR03086 family)